MKEKLKLHLGCGQNKIKGWINCDVSSEIDPDKIIDLEKKLPFERDSIEEVLAEHVLEHITNFIPLMHELHRICKDKSQIKIKVPFYSSWGQFNDPTHVRFFTPFTFNYFQKGTYSHEVGCEKDLFKVRKVKINFGVGRVKKLNGIFNPILNINHGFYCRFLAWIIPATEIEYELEVVK